MTTATFDIRPATLADSDTILEVYRRAARKGGGILRREDEVTEAYIRYNLDNSLRLGLTLVAESAGGLIVGELHSWTSETRQLAHVLTNLTVAVDPAMQGQGVGKALFRRLIEIATAMPKIRLIELYCREDNYRAIALYKSFGFVLEGRLKGRVWQEDGPYLDDLLMALHLPTAG